MRQGRDLSVNEALLRVRRLLRQEPRAVAAAFEEAAGQDGCLNSLQVVQLLQQQELMPGDLGLNVIQFLRLLAQIGSMADWIVFSVTTPTEQTCCASLTVAAAACAIPGFRRPVCQRGALHAGFAARMGSGRQCKAQSDRPVCSTAATKAGQSTLWHTVTRCGTRA